MDAIKGIVNKVASRKLAVTAVAGLVVLLALIQQRVLLIREVAVAGLVLMVVKVRQQLTVALV